MRPRGTHRAWVRVLRGQRTEKGHEERGANGDRGPGDEYGAEEGIMGVPGDHLNGSWRKSHDPDWKVLGTELRESSGEARSRAARQPLTCAWATTRLLLPSPW